MSVTYTEHDLREGRRLFSAPSLFRLGVAKLEQLPPVRGVEIAFAGRSNVGKSSLINALDSTLRIKTSEAHIAAARIAAKSTHLTNADH